jgi:hypothetical protein
MENKIQHLFEFLKSNRELNNELQLQFCKSMVGQSKDPTHKLTSLLYHVVNTQPQPKMDLIAVFFQRLYANPEKLRTFKDFIKLLDDKQENNFEGLYKSVREQNGWGQKTAALFTKDVFLIHNKYNDSTLRFWDDVPKRIEKVDKLYLPVDRVILTIFQKMDNQTKWTFDKINRILNKKYTGDEIEVWDDLWFWGFFNQKVVNKERVFEWNESKYWILNETDKNPMIIGNIKKKSREFIEILEK